MDFHCKNLQNQIQTKTKVNKMNGKEKCPETKLAYKLCTDQPAKLTRKFPNILQTEIMIRKNNINKIFSLFHTSSYTNIERNI